MTTAGPGFCRVRLNEELIMNNDITNWLWFGLGVIGVFAAAKGFSKNLNKVEKTGLTLSGGAALAISGYVLLRRIEDTTNQGRRLL